MRRSGIKLAAMLHRVEQHFPGRCPHFVLVSFGQIQKFANKLLQAIGRGTRRSAPKGVSTHPSRTAFQSPSSQAELCIASCSTSSRAPVESGLVK